MTEFYSVFNRENAGANALKRGMTQVGVPYQWGGTEWNVGLDCSGLAMESYLRVGIRLPRVTYEQCLVHRLPHGTELKAGDLIFIDDDAGPQPGHVMIYVSPGKVLQAPFTGEDVQVSDYDTTKYVAITRPANAYGALIKPPVLSDLFANQMIQVTGAEAVTALKNGWAVRGWDGEHFPVIPSNGVPAGVVKYSNIDWAKKRP